MIWPDGWRARVSGAQDGAENDLPRVKADWGKGKRPAGSEVLASTPLNLLKGNHDAYADILRLFTVLLMFK